ncbi:hypothetical protein ACET3Z_006240 [Daucus carota]
MNSSQTRNDAIAPKSSDSARVEVLDLSSTESTPIYAPSNNLAVGNIYKPSGIGLHLNSLVKALPVGCAATLKSTENAVNSQASSKAVDGLSGCFNTPEYQDKVLETRRQIVSRDPLAFAPKILQRVSESPANITQSNVGCSDRCRCSWCKNAYGKKEEYGSGKQIGNTEATMPEISYDQKLENILNSVFSIPHNVTNDTSSEACPGGGCFSSLNSCQLSSSPIRAVVPSGGKRQPPKLFDLDSWCDNILEDLVIPETLKEDHISFSEVNLSSPNDKRVSPTHSHFPEVRPSSSFIRLGPGKYILKAAPSFSPLAGCNIDGKSASSPSTNAPDYRNI